MPDALPLTGLFGKVPAHGDFVRRGLPTSFVAPWDAWLQQGMEAARERLGARWAALWDSAPPWRFALPAGACGPDAVAGVMLPSQDMVGRRFPITLVALLPPGVPLPAPAWFVLLEAAALAGRAGQADADALAAAVPDPRADLPETQHIAAPTEPCDAPPAWSEPALDMFGREPPLASMEAPAVLLSGAPEARDASDDPSLDHLAGASAPRGIVATGEPDQTSPESSDNEDLLAIFAGAAPLGSPEGLPAQGRPDPPGDVPAPPSMATPDAPAPALSDGTLAFLLAEGVAQENQSSALAATPSDGDALLPGGASEEPNDTSDPLAALIAAGETPLRGTMAVADDRPFARPDPMPSAAPTVEALPAVDAPAAPPGGGWWTGGGGRLVPTVRALPALLSAGDFASLLEADA